MISFLGLRSLTIDSVSDILAFGDMSGTSLLNTRKSFSDLILNKDSCPFYPATSINRLLIFLSLFLLY